MLLAERAMPQALLTTVMLRRLERNPRPPPGNSALRDPLSDHSRALQPDSSWLEDESALLATGDHATLEYQLAAERD
jgi:hypothetical protein